MPLRFQGVTQCRQWRQRSGGKFDHPAHQIHAPHLFGHAVLHLQTGIHLKEVKAGGVAVIDEFNGARAAVVDRFTQRYRRLAQCLRHARRQVWRGRLLQHFLVTPLHRAVAHAEGNHLALAVAKQLYFQMTRPLDVLFDKYTRVAEVIFPQTHYRIERVTQRFCVIADAHTDAAASRRAFQHHRISHFGGSGDGLVNIGQQVGALQHRNLVRFRQRASGMF